MLIAFASIVGKCLLDSGGADRIVRTALRVLAERECLSTFTAMLSLMGVVGLIVVMLLAKLFPLV